MDYGQEEAAAVQGADPRQYLVMTEQFLKDDSGKVTGLQLVEIKWDKDAQGRFVPVKIEESRRTIPCDLALLAMGFLGPEQEIIQKFGVETDRAATSRPTRQVVTSVFPSLPRRHAARPEPPVVWAINEGRAAREVDRFLMGVTHLP
jgi:glutamate synthase (NADPH/NADH) small chain